MKTMWGGFDTGLLGLRWIPQESYPDVLGPGASDTAVWIPDAASTGPGMGARDGLTALPMARQAGSRRPPLAVSWRSDSPDWHCGGGDAFLDEKRRQRDAHLASRAGLLIACSVHAIFIL